MTGAKLKVELAHVAQLLQRLQYSGAESVEDTWLRRLLLDPEQPRKQLLEWVLQELSPGTHRYEDSKVSRQSKSLQRLCGLGLCSAGDGDVVEGLAPAGQQLKFWRLLLETLCNKRALHTLGNSAPLQARTDALLHTLCSSRAIALSTKGEACSVLPGDLQERYKSWCRQGRQQQVSAAVTQVQEHLQQSKELYDQVPQEYKCVPSVEERQEATDRMAESLHKLTGSGQLYAQMHTQHLAPWQTETQQQELPSTGDVVRDVHQALQQLTQVLSNTAALADKTTELEAAEAGVLATQEQPSSVTSIVHRLAADAKT